jgi:hypothetical protein
MPVFLVMSMGPGGLSARFGNTRQREQRREFQMRSDRRMIRRSLYLIGPKRRVTGSFLPFRMVVKGKFVSCRSWIEMFQAYLITMSPSVRHKASINAFSSPCVN